MTLRSNVAFTLAGLCALAAAGSAGAQGPCMSAQTSHPADLRGQIVIPPDPTEPPSPKPPPTIEPGPGPTPNPDPVPAPPAPPAPK